MSNARNPSSRALLKALESFKDSPAIQKSSCGHLDFCPDCLSEQITKLNKIIGREIVLVDDVLNWQAAFRAAGYPQDSATLWARAVAIETYTLFAELGPIGKAVRQ